MDVNSGPSQVLYDTVVTNELHQQLQLHMLMQLDTGQDRWILPRAVCAPRYVYVCGHVSSSKSASKTIVGQLELNKQILSECDGADREKICIITF